MKRIKQHEKGYTLGEFTMLLVVLAVLGISIYYIFLDKKEPEPKPVEKPKYKCMTTNSGMIPLKVVIANPNNAEIYTKPNTASTRAQTQLEFFEKIYVFQQQNDFFQVGTDPFLEKTLGWIKRTDAIPWSHRQGLEFKYKPNVPVYIWEKKDEIGDTGNADYQKRTDVAVYEQYPILEIDKSRYKIALTWQSGNWEEKGAATGWTDSLKTPGDATVVCYITKTELKERMEKLLAALKELQNQPYASHPIIQLFKEDLNITFGGGLNLEDESIGYMKKVAGEAPKMPAVFMKQPEEIRGELQKMWRTFTRLRAYYEDENNWKKRGAGWIPMELIPGN
jgi:hypothetical protein